MGVNALQQHHAFKLGEILAANQFHLFVKHLASLSAHARQQVFIGDGAGFADHALQRHDDSPFVGQYLLQRRQIPLLFDRFKRHVLPH